MKTRIAAGEKPAPLSFRTESYEAGGIFEEKRQPWCKVGYALTGVMEARVEGKRFLCPPHYATWIPADAVHACHNRENVKFVSIYIDRDLCAGMPETACTLALSPLIKAILADFAERRITVPQTEADRRLAFVLVDQLLNAPRRESFLPVSNDDLLQPVIDALQADPGDRRSLSEWARLLQTTEKTLSRRFLGHLGVSFNEWRQRLKLVASLSLIEDGKSVQSIAKTLGYNSPSAFIAMFRRLTGTSPTNLRSTPARTIKAASTP
ncbi:HTH-type transcriptional regulator NimR [Agrobacterium fabrum]|uniref:AraC family transcriptional regulator n=1 Tax=Agrobacterium fabrum TaxID=1176649 RepID=UPI001DC0DC78|nr:helix-turn-helix transcriptional regulator [Agrobacterium fabrum]CAH0272718.1 HTH-type transcriptional regulator NimR [Agrobacterium fabrum]CAH0277035.1 HTH-type transcriptional regulator NimR [Agrobacterium fabrum]